MRDIQAQLREYAPQPPRLAPVIPTGSNIFAKKISRLFSKTPQSGSTSTRPVPVTPGRIVANNERRDEEAVIRELQAYVDESTEESQHLFETGSEGLLGYWNVSSTCSGIFAGSLLTRLDATNFPFSTDLLSIRCQPRALPCRWNASFHLQSAQLHMDAIDSSHTLSKAAKSSNSCSRLRRYH